MCIIAQEYEPLTIPEHLEFVPVNGDGKKVAVLINHQPVISINTYLCGTRESKELMVNASSMKEIEETFARLVLEFPFRIRNFEYNGFFGKDLEGFAPYWCKFVRWSGDPGVAVMQCSDGRERLIPTFALPAGVSIVLPDDNTRQEDKILFGRPSQSQLSEEGA
jgi:hypothetical protein